jgi:dolichol-phosphate mannosyltransferase
LERHSINYKVLVINDHSQDNTEDLLRQLSDNNHELRYINNYLPHGFGFAVRCGLENYEGDAVAIVMADGSDDPDDIVQYYRKILEGYDCVFGSRFIQGSEVIDYPFHKLLLNRLGNSIIQILFGLKYNDITNAFKIYRREVMEGISPLISHHFNLTVEMPLKAIARGYSYIVIPIKWKNRKKGISKLRIKEVWGRYLFIALYVLLEKSLYKDMQIQKHQKRYEIRSRNL